MTDAATPVGHAIRASNTRMTAAAEASGSGRRDKNATCKLQGHGHAHGACRGIPRAATPDAAKAARHAAGREVWSRPMAILQTGWEDVSVSGGGGTATESTE